MTNLSQTQKKDLENQEQKESTNQIAEKEKTLEEKEGFSFSEKEKRQQEKFHYQPATNQVIDQETEQAQKADEIREIEAGGKKIEQLLILAQDKGVDFALKVAEKIQDHLLLDLFHDALIQKGIKK